MSASRCAENKGMMPANWIPITIVALYVVVLFAVTGWARRLTAKGGGGIVGYLLAGRGLPYWVAAALLAGLAVGGVSTIGTAEWAYSRGISAGWYNAAWAAGAFILALGAARRGVTGASKSRPCRNSSNATTAPPRGCSESSASS